MWQSFDAAKLSEPANDNATWVSGPHGIGAIGYEPAIAGLEGATRSSPGSGWTGNVHGHVYAPEDADAADAPHYCLGQCGAGRSRTCGYWGPMVAGACRWQNRVPAPLPSCGWLSPTAALRCAAACSSALPIPGPASRIACGSSSPFLKFACRRGPQGIFPGGHSAPESADLLVTYPGPRRRDGRRAGSCPPHRRERGRPRAIRPPSSWSAPRRRRKISPALCRTRKSIIRPQCGPTGRTAVLRPMRKCPANQDGGTHRALALTIAAEPGVDERAPIVKAVDDGFVVALADARRVGGDR